MRRERTSGSSVSLRRGASTLSERDGNLSRTQRSTSPGSRNPRAPQSIRSRRSIGGPAVIKQEVPGAAQHAGELLRQLSPPRTVEARAYTTEISGIGISGRPGPFRFSGFPSDRKTVTRERSAPGTIPDGQPAEERSVHPRLL